MVASARGRFLIRYYTIFLIPFSCKIIDRWVQEEGVLSNYGHSQLVGLYIVAQSPAGVTSFWAGNPAHRVQIGNKLCTDSCAYAIYINSEKGASELQYNK